MREWISLPLLIIIPIIATFAGLKGTNETEKSITRFYWKNILYSAAVILLFFIVAPSLFTKVDFEIAGKGIFISDNILSPIATLFYTPFFISLLFKKYLYPKDILTAKYVFGYPVQFLPNSHKKYPLFCLYIITGVIFEELLCRQFAFRAFNETLHLEGDVLLVVTAGLFAIAHLYQGWKGLLSSFILGLILGKFFQMKENLLFPILLHMVLNMTILTLSYRRIKDLNKT